MIEFREIQKIDRGLLAFLGIASVGAIAGPLVTTYLEVSKAVTDAEKGELLTTHLLIFCGVMLFSVAIFALIYSQRLEIEINRFRLRFRMPPFVKWKEINANDIEGYRVEKAKWFQKMRKSRMHYNPFTKKASYMMARKYFVELKLNSGKTILLSTCKPREIETSLEGLMKKEK